MRPLNHRDFGGTGEPPVVILHGLLGSSRNWQAVAGELAKSRRVLAVDLRNHGASPHDERHDYAEMESDLVEWLDDQRLPRVALLGHSMGGKLAMAFACHQPRRVERLVVVDIAPRDYDVGRIGSMLDVMAGMDLAKVGSRVEAEAILQEAVPDWGLMKFLATNLDRDESGRYFWRANVTVLRAEIGKMAANPLWPGDRFDGPTLFVAGGKSDHVRVEDHAAIRGYFPAAQIEVLAGAGHNPHFEAREEFVAALRRFL